jgi:SAM-dependent methyltransferase
VSQIDKLLTPEGLALLRPLEAQNLKTEPIKLIEKLRKAGHDPELVSQVLTQLKLRSKATSKFGDFAQQMLFTEPGLEQATRLNVAAHHAGRFLEAQVTSVTDLGCGIGADSLAFAAAGLKVVAVERDETTAALASFNLASFENASVVHADAIEHQALTQGLWFDPARRDLSHTGDRHKVLSPEDFTPNLNWVFDLARTKPSGVKLGPAFPLELIPEDAHAEWVSNAGDLVELTLWFGMGRQGQRSALQIGPKSHRYLASKAVLAELGSLERYLYEPDPAMIRSGLMGNLAQELGLRTLSPGIAYLSSNDELHSPWLRGFEVLAVLPLDEKKIAAWCREHEIGILEIKKRGVDITPEQLRPKLRLKGTGTATLVLTKVGGARQALFCQPIR